MSPKLLLMWALLSGPALARTPQAVEQPAGPEPGVMEDEEPEVIHDRRVVLSNGVTAILRMFPDAEGVAVESLSPMGVLHEPAGMPHAALLLERLIQRAPAGKLAAGQAYGEVASRGSSRSETLGDWSHHGYAVPPELLESVLRIEAQRLTALDLGRELVATESEACYREAELFRSNPTLGMLRYAFMALGQHWRHARSESRLMGGLEIVDLEKLRDYLREVTRLDRTRIVLAGAFEEERAIELLEASIGSIAMPSAGNGPPPIRWAELPRHSTVRWDTGIRAIHIAWAPPADRLEQLMLTWVASALRQELARDRELLGVMDCLYGTDAKWPVGELPLFLYMQLKPDADAARAEALLLRKVQAWLAEGPTRVVHLQILIGARQMFEHAMLGWEQLSDEMTFNMNMKEWRENAERLRSFFFGQLALDRGRTDQLLGDTPEQMLKRLEELEREDVVALIECRLTAQHRVVTHLVPID